MTFIWPTDRTNLPGMGLSKPKAKDDLWWLDRDQHRNYRHSVYLFIFTRIWQSDFKEHKFSWRKTNEQLNKRTEVTYHPTSPLPDRQADWRTDWLTGCSTNKPASQPANHSTSQRTKWFIGHLPDQPTTDEIAIHLTNLPTMLLTKWLTNSIK